MIDTFFLSYSRTDEEFVLKLADDLRSGGAKIWLDQVEIQTGERWDTTIQSAVQEATGLMVILSPSSVVSENVLDEIGAALEAKKRVIPVVYISCDIPLRLTRVQYIDATGDYAQALERLQAATLEQRPRKVFQWWWNRPKKPTKQSKQPSLGSLLWTFSLEETGRGELGIGVGTSIASRWHSLAPASHLLGLDTCGFETLARDLN